MKRVSFACFLLLVFSSSFAQKKMGASGFYIESLYQQVKAKDVDKYLAIFSDSLKLGSSMKLPAQTGLGVGFIYYMEGVEIDMGFTARPTILQHEQYRIKWHYYCLPENVWNRIEGWLKLLPGQREFFYGLSSYQ